ncbi:TPA: glycosyltransferase family 2 protein, partial [Klebsiella pneumoniae]|nr:glycosyltransferase family 2 protein [Klebsiella pneumoniae]
QNVSTIEKINKEFKFIKLDKNIGLASAQNIGIREAFNYSTHIVIFDQDSEITVDFVANQLKCESLLLSRGIKVSAVGPKFYDKDSGYEYPATVYKGPFIKKIPVVDEPVEATFVIASGSLMRTEVLKDVGLMLDDFFIDFVDVEWCLRASSKGYKCFINPYETMKHSIGDLRIDVFGRKISLHSDFRKFYIYRNGVYMTRLGYVPVGYKIRVFVFNLIRTCIGLVLSKQKSKTLKASIKGWINGMGRFNKKSPL